MDPAHGLHSKVRTIQLHAPNLDTVLRFQCPAIIHHTLRPQLPMATLTPTTPLLLAALMEWDCLASALQNSPLVLSLLVAWQVPRFYHHYTD